MLKTLSWGPRHGYAIARWLEETTDERDSGRGRLALSGALPHGAEGMDRSRMGHVGARKKAKIYRLTAKGRKSSSAETAEWAAFANVVSRVLLPDNGTRLRHAHASDVGRKQLSSLIWTCERRRGSRHGAGVSRRDAHARVHRRRHGAGRRASGGDREVRQIRLMSTPSAAPSDIHGSE